MSYFDNYENPIDETIRTRVSCRTYQDRLIAEADKKKLLNFCEIMKQGLHGEKISFQLVEHNTEDLKERKLAGYGLFKNARSLIVGVIDKSDFCHVSYGYAMEHVVLKATELGLGTCWAGYFDPYLIKDVAVSDNQIAPAICLAGYAAGKRTLIEKMTRFAIRASKRRNWDKLFFHCDFRTPLTPETAGPYAEPLELLRLAPSSRNTQPWRIVKDKDQHGYHFFKQIVKARYEEKKLHDIDIGIAMCHFELAAEKNRLRGKWERTETNVPGAPDKTQYITSWTNN